LTVIPVGTHCVLELHGCSQTRLNDEAFIRDAISQASREGLSTLLSLTSHQFQPQGVTALALLAESHISVHTWPEHGYAAVDIFTCGETAQPQRACNHLLRAFEADDYRLKVIPRGMAAQDPQSAYTTRLAEEAELCPVAN
jgi:S-adenosylmethionine decarboxylase